MDFKWGWGGNIPFEEPVRRNEAKLRMMPKQSWDMISATVPVSWFGCFRVMREPLAVRICCSLVPVNCPTMAWCKAVGGLMVREYMNMEEVVAMMGS
jgi:hypothetical protein